MGLYINEINGIKAPDKGKVQFILKNAVGSTVIPTPDKWQEGLVCVVENYAFDAAGYAFDKEEMLRFATIGNQRTKTWLLVPDAKKYAK